jgi:hypothetical protein
MSTTKSATSAVVALQAELAALQARIAALTGESLSVSAAAVGRFTQAHWHTLRFAMVVGGAEKPQLAKGRKGYALVKGADIRWYMGCKGFENTLKAQASNDEPIGLHAEPNAKTGRTQVQYAQEILTAMVEAGFIDPKSKLLVGESKATKAARK